MRSRVLLAFATLMLLCSCSQINAQMSGAEVSDDRPATRSAPILETVDWANLNGMISVLVRNNSGRILRRADAIITLQDTEGVTIGSSANKIVEGSCCTAVDVPPGATFGFYLYNGDAGNVTGVQVDYKNAAWDAGGSKGGPQATVQPINLHSNRNGAVVSARVTAQGGPIDAAVIQAVLNGPDGEFLSVISGTWFCFVPGQPRRIWMQLFQQVPDGTTVDSISAFPKSDDVDGGDANPAGTCTPSPPSQSSE